MTGNEPIFLILELVLLATLPIAGIYLPRRYLEKEWVRRLYLGDIADPQKRMELLDRIRQRMPIFVRFFRVLVVVCIAYLLGAAFASYSLINSGARGNWLNGLIFVGGVLLFMAITAKCSIITGEYMVRRLGETRSSWW